MNVSFRFVSLFALTFLPPLHGKILRGRPVVKDFQAEMDVLLDAGCDWDVDKAEDGHGLEIDEKFSGQLCD